jgi:FMN hydrolase / 5-amino-6-(5-phospho-D-ribitylamino)uracil phosphatase
VTGLTAVAFDLMDTLVRDPYREALRAATGMRVRDLFSRRDATAYPAFECGHIDEDAYWEVYADAGIEVDVDAFHATRRELTAWLPGMRDLLMELDGRVERVVASNYPHWIAELRDGLLDGLVDRVVASHDLGVRKPDPRFYARLLDRCDLDAGEVLFVDDREANVEAATAAGLRAHLFAGADDLRRRLATEGVQVRVDAS